jgi:hypothetical protein
LPAISVDVCSSKTAIAPRARGRRRDQPQRTSDQCERFVAIDQAVRLDHAGRRHGLLAEFRAQIAQARFASGGNQLCAAAMRQHRYAARLERGCAEDGFLIGMRENCEPDGPSRDTLDRGVISSPWR